jgi:NAD(P)-dependent dehydrogenase (short-subunit alcohol dehydrogenase family)/quinol monooxygenase YgiN
MDLNEKVAVIVGGGAGIGAAGAAALAAEGVTVVIADIDQTAARNGAAKIVADGGRAVATRCDATSVSDLAALHTLALDTFGRVDIVWSHAGRALAGLLEQVPVDKWAELLDVNCMGPVKAFAEFAPSMVERGSGHLVITSSSLALFPEQIPVAAPYVLSKSALVGYARSLRAYLGPHSVGVSLLLPDATNTRHATDLPVVGLDAEAMARDLDVASLDSPERVAEALVAGLRDDRFFISLTPDVETRMRADLDGLLGAPAPSATVVVSGELAVDPRAHDRVVSALHEVGAPTVQEPGNLAYRWGADLDRRGVFYLFEEWESPQDLERHAQSAHGRAFLEVLGGLGPVTAALQVYDAHGSHPLELPD